MKSYIDDLDAVRKRIEEIKNENNQPGMSAEYPNVPRGDCYYCRENKTPCDGSCEFLGYLNYFRPVGELQTDKCISKEDTEHLAKAFKAIIANARRS